MISMSYVALLCAVPSKAIQVVPFSGKLSTVRAPFEQYPFLDFLTLQTLTKEIVILAAHALLLKPPQHLHLLPLHALGTFAIRGLLPTLCHPHGSCFIVSCMLTSVPTTSLTRALRLSSGQECMVDRTLVA